MPRPRVCARCQAPLPPAVGTGRPRRFCATACRKAAYRARASRTKQIRSEWWTPDHLRERVAEEFNLGLDAAACAASTLVADNWLGPTHPAAARRDALSVPSWAALTPPGKVVWLNSPYTPVPVLRAFLTKAAETAAVGTPVVTLVPASTSSAWWHDLVLGVGAEVEFLRGRLVYGGPHSTGGAAPWPSAIVKFGAAT